MLPSPRWPNGTGREPGISFTTAALASAMKSGTAATGTEMSCLIEPPSGFCAADISSRSFQNAPSLAEIGRDHGIVDDTPSSMPRARIDSRAARASSRDDDNSISTYQGCLARQGIADIDAVTHAEIDRDVRRA